jgi:hypothetical protein
MHIAIVTVWLQTSIAELNVCVTVHHQYSDVNNQQDATTFSFINLFKSAQHVTGDKFAHPQEHFLTAYTAFGTMYCNYKL